MTQLASDAIWRRRLDKIDNRVDDIRLPDDSDLDQDREWCEVRVEGNERRIRFHDYHEIYRVPGFYEELFYQRLKCCSPSCVAHLLQEVVVDFGHAPEDFRVLDLGAGNGMVGEEMTSRGADLVVGADIIPEARAAALRDRPGVYDDYLVTDFTDLPKKQEQKIRGQRLNCLTCVAALGYGDIPPLAFLKALDLIETPGWVGFNIKETFLRGDDTTGFNGLIRQLLDEEFMRAECYRRYRHRNTVAGDPLYYVAIVTCKLKDVSRELFEQWEAE